MTMSRLRCLVAQHRDKNNRALKCGAGTNDKSTHGSHLCFCSCLEEYSIVCLWSRDLCAFHPKNYSVVALGKLTL